MKIGRIINLLLLLCFLAFTVASNRDWLGLEFNQAKSKRYETALLNTAQSRPKMPQLRALAESGDPKAQHELGRLFLKLENMDAARKWFFKAAEQGYAPAQADFASMFYADFAMSKALGNEMGQGANAEFVVKWYRLAAQQGGVASQYMMGQMYYEGTGLAGKDHAEAVKWYRLAAEQGHAQAQEMVDQLAQ